MRTENREIEGVYFVSLKKVRKKIGRKHTKRSFSRNTYRCFSTGNTDKFNTMGERTLITSCFDFTAFAAEFRLFSAEKQEEEKLLRTLFPPFDGRGKKVKTPESVN